MPVQLHVATILVADISLTALIGAVLLFVWLQNRSSGIIGWWGVAHLCQSAGLLLLGAGEFTSLIPAIIFGPALVLTAYALMWIGARRFDGRPMRFLMTFSGVFFWLFAVSIVSSPTAALVFSASNAVYCLAIAFEFWRGRKEPLMSRWPAIVLLSLSGAAFLSWNILSLLPPTAFDTGVLPAPFGYMILITLLGKTALAFIILGMAKERLELRQRKEALTDPLTGLPNRRAFFRQALRRMRTRKNADGPVSLLMMDLDRFKAINDRYGHAFGDRVLAIFAEILSEGMKATDIIGRVGGEEFVVLLSDTDVASAEAVAERVRFSFAEKAATVDGVPLQATVSIGVASSEVGECDVHSLLGQADAALYAAKNAGRNCVRLSDAAKRMQPQTKRPPRVAVPA